MQGEAHMIPPTRPVCPSNDAGHEPTQRHPSGNTARKLAPGFGKSVEIGDFVLLCRHCDRLYTGKPESEETKR